MINSNIQSNIATLSVSGIPLPCMMRPPLIAMATDAITYGSKTTRPIPDFLYHLIRILKDSANHHLIEWDAGRIIVHEPTRLEAEVLGRYFRHSKYSSFQRQLNYFGFRKNSGKRKMSPCSYTNEAATEDLSSLVHLKRKTAKKPGKTTELFPLNQVDDNSTHTSLEDKILKVQPSVPSNPQLCLAPANDETNEIDKTEPPVFGSHPFVVSAEEYGPPGSQVFPQAVRPLVSTSSSSFISNSNALSQNIEDSKPQNIPLHQNPFLFPRTTCEPTQQPSDEATHEMNDAATFLTLESFFGGDIEDEDSSSDGSVESSWLPDPLNPMLDGNVASPVA